MKKRIICLLLAVLLFAPEGAFAAVSGVLNQQMATRSGPGTKYTEELGTFSSSTSISVVAQVETNGTVWYQVEFSRNGKQYRAYTGKKRVDAYGDIPWESSDYVEDTPTVYARAYYGPGEKYAMRGKGIGKGDVVRVFNVEGSWALCEYREEGKWARGYVKVDDLKNTVAVALTATPEPVITPAPTPRNAFNIIDRDKKICIDYYGNEYHYSRYDEEFAYMVGMLPVMHYFDGVPCIHSHTAVYSGPSVRYWRRYIGGDYAFTGLLDTNLRIYGKENGWIMIRYPSDANGGYRYGWVIPEAISVENQNRTPNVEFAYLDAVTTRYVDATDDPDRSIQYVGTSISAHITVTALAFLDEERNWVYCEYSLREGGATYIARGFIPADGLRLK